MTAPSGPDNQEPDFSAFENWLNDGSTGQWPWIGVREKELTAQQKKIVEENARLLLDKKAWAAHVDAFEEQLNLIKNEKERAERRADFHIRFDRHVFPDGFLNCSGLVFPCNVSFFRTCFGKGDKEFLGVRFLGHASFMFAEFGDGDIEFDVMGLSNGASFQNARFGKGNFLLSRIDPCIGHISFQGAYFQSENVDFGLVSSKPVDISFKNAFIKGDFRIYKSLFSKVDFSGLQVTGGSNLSLSIFKQVPNFRDTKFERSPEVARMEVPPPKLKGIWPFKIVENVEDVTKYRKLKSMALAANDHEKDGEFFAYEMLAKRGVEETRPIGLFINWLYFTLSNFGQSYIRPAVGLGANLVIFLMLQAIYARAFLSSGEALWFGFSHSFRNFLPFLGSLFRFAPRPEGHVSGFDGLFHKLAHEGANIDLIVGAGIFQNFLGLIFLFLLFLGLRNKFRLK